MKVTKTVEARVRSMTRQERVAYLRERGWYRLSGGPTQTWFAPGWYMEDGHAVSPRDDPGFYSLAAAIRTQLQREEEEKPGKTVRNVRTGRARGRRALRLHDENERR